MEEQAASPRMEIPPQRPAGRYGDRDEAQLRASVDPLCQKLGIMVPGRDCSVAQRALEYLDEHPLAYKYPERMVFDEPADIVLAIDTSGGDPSVSLAELPGVVEAESTQVAATMSAQLSGSAFQIKPEGPQKQSVNPIGETRWQWKVTPKQPGKDKILTLTVYAHVIDGETAKHFQVRTFDRKIFVDVTLWQQIASLRERIGLVEGIIGGVAGILGGLGGLAWWRRRR